MVICALFVSYFLFSKVNWFVGVCFFYFSAHSIARMTYPMLFWPLSVSDLEVLVGFESMVEQGYIYLSIIVLAFYFLRKHLNHVEDFLLALGFIDAVVLCCKFIFYTLTKARFFDFWYYFVMNNASIDATFLAALLPLAFARYNGSIQHKVILTFLILPCIFTYSSSGIAGLGLAIGMYLWSKNKFSLKATIYGGLAAGSVAMIGWLMQNERLIASSGRSFIWKLGLRYWYYNDSKLFGEGIGTWYMIGPALQMNDALDKGKQGIEAFFWMHNDWLQLLVESGVIGLMLVFTLWIYLIIKARHTPKIFASLVVLGVLAFVQMPLRHFILSVLLAFLATWAVSPPAKNKP